MNEHIKHKTIIITGASQGIGMAAALHLTQYGANVILVARNKEKLVELQKVIHTQQGKAEIVVGDVAKYDTLSRAVDMALKHFGSVDALINNAGLIDPIARLADSNVDDWSKIIDINYKGVYHGLRATLPVMLTQNRGTIINISSGAATSPLEGWSHYCSSKAAVLMLTRCAHKEYNEQGIRAIGLSPGTVATDMQIAIKNSGINPVSKLDWEKHIPAEWVAQTLAYLLSDEASDLSGTDFSIKNDEGRKRVGLPVIK
ncbi:SDR family oxidoreductase [Marinomonas epiphytica]